MNRCKNALVGLRSEPRINDVTKYYTAGNREIAGLEKWTFQSVFRWIKLRTCQTRIHFTVPGGKIMRILKEKISAMFP